MHSRWIALTALIAAPLVVGAPPEPEEFSTTASDGVVVFGDIYESPDGRGAPLILLFHQGGANARGEYGDFIAPRLVDGRYNVIAIDQRLGGGLFEGVNRTKNANPGPDRPYCIAWPDLVETMAFVDREGFTGPRFAWGSSYSAALVLRMAGEYADELAGVLAFSPASGGPMGECGADRFVADIGVPAFIALPQKEFDMPQKKPLLEAFEGAGIEVHVQPQGVHGSSMLHPDRAAGGT
jgi:pimeloyl-ACP methyl ester carboxylesterase